MKLIEKGSQPPREAEIHLAFIVSCTDANTLAFVTSAIGNLIQSLHGNRALTDDQVLELVGRHLWDKAPAANDNTSHPDIEDLTPPDHIL